tara:strand:- start:6169 stop:7500 length:1332 start_codon:yes stop_codon:yes gene_type:complete
MTTKIKVLTISDHPLSPSGVGIQANYFITGLLKTDNFVFYSLGGAIKHDNYNPAKVEQFGDDWIIQPIDGYGNQELLRSVVRNFKPDIIWFMTDPRFFPWLWDIENEIRALCPLVYYHVWDNYPYPYYNKPWYDSTDVVVGISKVTSDIVKTVSPDVKQYYLPHAVPMQQFRSLPATDVSSFRSQQLGIDDNNFFIFWTNRNARRKQSGSLLYWFKDFLDQLEKTHGHRNSTLLMHTEPKDPNGQDLYVIAAALGLDVNRNVLFSKEKVGMPELCMLYNAADTCISISDAEGFGLYTFESLACETPIIATLTGGLQEQVSIIDDMSQELTLERHERYAGQNIETHCGIGLEPASKAIIGSQDVPYIYEDRLSGNQVSSALMTMYEYGSERRAELGKAGRKHLETKYDFEKYVEQWEKIMLDVYAQNGSWDTRKNYKNWELKVI